MSQAGKEGRYYLEKLNLESKRNVSSTSLSGGNFYFPCKIKSVKLTRYEAEITSCHGSDREYKGK